MPQSLVKILVHIVFSTKDRIALIPPELETELYRYIHGVIETMGGRLVIAGGTPNHIHLLVSLGRIDIPTLIGDVKRLTSVWMKKKGVEKFYWQKGYGAFSIGQSQVPAVSQYIRDQDASHEARLRG